MSRIRLQNASAQRFLVPARQVRVAADVGIDQAGILLQDLARLVAVADPEFVLLFLPPLERRGSDPQTSRIRSFLWPAQTCPTVNTPLAPLSNRISTDARSSTLMSTSSNSSSPVAAKRLPRPVRPLALRDDGRDVAEHVRDAQAGHVLHQVAPVRSDVAERRRLAALVRLEAPRVVGVLAAASPACSGRARSVGRPMSPRGDRVARLLHQRVAAVVERHGVEDAGLGRLVAQRLRPRPPSARAACRRRRACRVAMMAALTG